MKLKDYTNQTFGALRALQFEKREGSRTLWKFQCQCGSVSIHNVNDVTRGQIKSCGCLRRALARSSKKAPTTHGARNTRLYTIYTLMVARCNNPSNTAYDNYGGRGIKCRWGSFSDFKKDMGQSYDAHIELHGIKSTTIDRINNDADYCKENCRWATAKQQSRNRRSNLIFVLDGKKGCLAHFVEAYGQSYMRVYKRIKRGWQLADALIS